MCHSPPKKHVEAITTLKYLNELEEYIMKKEYEDALECIQKLRTTLRCLVEHDEDGR